MIEADDIINGAQDCIDQIAEYNEETAVDNFWVPEKETPSVEWYQQQSKKIQL